MADDENEAWLDAYAVLQVVPSAEQDVVRAAYRALARLYHPDHSTDAAAATRMVELNRAWELIGDPKRRAGYDTANALRHRAREDGQKPTPTATTTPQTQRHAPPPAADADGPVRPPQRRTPPSGSVLDFGRYAGWSIGEIARIDRDYLEWFKRTTIGRRYRSEIEAILDPAPTPRAGRIALETKETKPRSGWLRRR